MLRSNKTGPMRAYYFTSQKIAMEHVLPERRMKLSLVHELNDPFELLSPQLTDKDMRQLNHELHGLLIKTMGVICFSDNMRSPLMWAHYAEKHNGMCLGFDIPALSADWDNSIIKPMMYETKRLKIELAKIQASVNDRIAFIGALLHTKAKAWEYECEYRMMAELREKETNGFYYVDFGPNMVLREVIIGCLSKLLPTQVASKVRGLPAPVKVYKARAGFKDFEMVRDRKLPIVNVLGNKLVCVEEIAIGRMKLPSRKTANPSLRIRWPD